jgi:hypothetical protein
MSAVMMFVVPISDFLAPPAAHIEARRHTNSPDSVAPPPTLLPLRRGLLPNRITLPPARTQSTDAGFGAATVSLRNAASQTLLQRHL